MRRLTAFAEVRMPTRWRKLSTACTVVGSAILMTRLVVLFMWANIVPNHPNCKSIWDNLGPFL